jgi:hypothetical protein
MFENLSTQQLIQIMRSRVNHRNPDIVEPLRAYYNLTGTTDINPLLPHRPKATTTCRVKFEENRRMYRAHYLAMKVINATRPSEIQLKGEGSMSMDGHKSSIQIEMDDMPRFKPTVDYSGGALQGQYMGSKYKRNDRKAGKVTWIR